MLIEKLRNLKDKSQKFLEAFKDKGLPSIAKAAANRKMSAAISETYSLPEELVMDMIKSPLNSLQNVQNDDDRYFLMGQRGFFLQGLANFAQKRFRAFAPFTASIIGVLLSLIAFTLMSLHGLNGKVTLTIIFGLWVAPLLVKIVFVGLIFMSSLLNKSFEENTNQKDGDKESRKKENKKTVMVAKNTLYDIYFCLFVPKFLVKYILPSGEEYEKAWTDTLSHYNSYINECWNEEASDDVNHKYFKNSNPINKDGRALNTMYLSTDAVYGKLSSVFTECGIHLFSSIKTQFLVSLMALYGLSLYTTEFSLSLKVLTCLISSSVIIFLGIIYSILLSLISAKRDAFAERSAHAAMTEKNTACLDLAVAAKEDWSIATEALEKRIAKSVKEDKTKNIKLGLSKGIADGAFNIPYGVDKNSPVYLEPQAINQHIITFGRPGSGKTVLSKAVAKYCCNENKYGALFLDGKFGQLAKDLSLELGELKILTPYNSTINPLENLTPDEAASVIIDTASKLLADATGKSMDNPFFNEQGKSLVRCAVILLDIAQFLKIGVDITDIRDIYDDVEQKKGKGYPKQVAAAATFPEKLVFLEPQLLDIHDEDKALYRCITSAFLVLLNPVFAYSLVWQLQEIISEAPEKIKLIEDEVKCDVGIVLQTLIYAAKDDEVGGGQSAGTRGTLENALNKLNENPALRRWNTAKTGEQVENIQYGEQYAIVIAKEFGDAGKIYSIAIKERAYSALRNRGNFNDLDDKHKPVIIMVDEWQAIVTKSDEQMVAMARSAGVGCYFITQSYNSIEACLGESSAKSVIGNFNTILAFQVDFYTAEYLKFRFGASFKIKATSGHVSKGYRDDLKGIEASGSQDFNGKYIENFSQIDSGVLNLTAAYKDKGVFTIEYSPNATAEALVNFLNVKFTMLAITTRCDCQLIEFVDTTPDFAKAV